MIQNQITETIIGCAIDVHRTLGPGLLEKVYEECLYFSLIQKTLKVERQKPIPIIFKEVRLECGYRIDLLVEDEVIVEIKSVSEIAPIHKAQLMTYMKLADIDLGLLINFNVKLLRDGIVRWVL